MFVSTNFYILLDKIEKNNLGKLYRNDTGPGQYEHHELIGKMVVDSN